MEIIIMTFLGVAFLIGMILVQLWIIGKMKYYLMQLTSTLKSLSELVQSVDTKVDKIPDAIYLDNGVRVTFKYKNERMK